MAGGEESKAAWLLSAGILALLQRLVLPEESEDADAPADIDGLLGEGASFRVRKQVGRCRQTYAPSFHSFLGYSGLSRVGVCGSL